ncbi:MAG: hypothetical protein AAF203_09115 [Pseudomonadota bacterium]
MQRDILAFFIVFLFSSLQAHATKDLQGHLRTGIVQGEFSGASSGEFSVLSSLELEGEYFLSGRSSILAKATISLDQESGQFKYVYMGLGQRFYLWSRGRPVETYSEGVFASHQPKLRLFGEYGIGLAQIQIQSVTDVLSVQSTVVELGIGGGAIYQISKNFGISFNLMGSKGFSISSVSVDSTVIRGLIGVTGYL